MKMYRLILSDGSVTAWNKDYNTVKDLWNFFHRRPIIDEAIF